MMDVSQGSQKVSAQATRGGWPIGEKRMRWMRALAGVLLGDCRSHMTQRVLVVIVLSHLSCVCGVMGAWRYVSAPVEGQMLQATHFCHVCD